MNSKCTDFVNYIINHAPQHNKQVLIDDACAKFSFIRDRTVYHNDSFAVRFSYSKSSSDSFSNTVLSLSALEKYDKIPFFVVLVRKTSSNMILLANTTFLKKISHSSQKLSMSNIVGSFNGSDIMRCCYDKENSHENFDSLFAIHQGLDWEDNLSRLVDASSKIKAVSRKFMPSDAEERNIYDSVSRADEFVSSADFSVLKADLDERCTKSRTEILIASHIENTNIRGRLIESLVTSDAEERQRIVDNLHDIEKALPSYDTKNGLGDYYRAFYDYDTYTDIKTKVVYLDSNPKAYNVDKFLKQMADPRSVFLFYFIGIDEKSEIKTLLCSVYHGKLIENTILQHHWAGRNTRGVAQFSGAAISEMLNEEKFVNDIYVERAEAFLRELLNR